MIEPKVEDQTIPNRPKHSSQLFDTIVLIKEFLAKRRGFIKSIDLWTLIKAYYPEDPTVSYWRDRDREGHAIPVEIAKALNRDKEIVRVGRGITEVYYKLDSGQDVI